ncbi:MAG: hypothetical protein DHS80DRAFT_16717 [Piptocephalis tieghemiana]|nr:MAG: hypothetical protein DHS80DRAFT_16717 [Piptocephalis tieghemiana]
MSNLSHHVLSGSLSIFDKASCLHNRLLSFTLSWIPFTAPKLRVHYTTQDSAILITGTSSGIGKALALYLAQLGYTVFATVRQKKAGEELKEEAASEAAKTRLHPILMDLTEMDRLEGIVQDLLQQCTKNHLTLVALINNAGIGHPLPVELTPASELETTFRTNFLGPAELTRLLIPTLRRSQGRIINMGSLAGTVNPIWFGAYSGSKAAVFAWNDVLRREMFPFGVGVSLIQPGVICSPGSFKTKTQIISNMSDEEIQAHGYSSKRHQHMPDIAPLAGLPIKHVTDAVLDALLSPWPKSRYLIGWDARIMVLLVQWFGHRVLDPMIGLLFHYFGIPYPESQTRIGYTGMMWFLAIMGVLIMWCLT